jgi:hypothetical protein
LAKEQIDETFKFVKPWKITAHETSFW